VDLLSLAGPAVALVVLVGLWILSAVTAVFRYYGFELRRQGEELRYERGLLQRYSGTIPLEKVQTLRLRENALARALGYAGLVIETAGYGPGQDGGAQSAVPLAKRDRALALAREVEPVGDIAFKRPPKRARTRYLVRYALVVLAATGALWAVDAVTGWVPVWYLAAGLLLAVPPAAHLAWRNRGYHAGENYFVTRNGFWRRETVIVPYDRVQTVASSRTVFQQRRDLGTLRVDTASTGGFFGTAAAAVDVDGALAEHLREDVHDRFQRSMGAD
jgi:putative membrane protein